MKSFTLPLALAFAATLASAPADTQSTPPNRNRIEREEIDETHSSNVLNLVRSRRPNWLTRQQASTFRDPTGNGALLVFHDGALLEGVRELELINVANVDLVEYLNAGQTEHRFGRFAPNGAIVVTSRGAQRPTDHTPSQSL